MNYSNLNGGQPGVAFRELTGMPTHTFWSNKISGKKFFKIVTEADKKGWVMAASCRYETGVNLVTGHAYALIGTVVLKDGGE